VGEGHYRIFEGVQPLRALYFLFVLLRDISTRVSVILENAGKCVLDPCDMSHPCIEKFNRFYFKFLYTVTAKNGF
jgi:hypothetical protein